MPVTRVFSRTRQLVCAYDPVFSSGRAGCSVPVPPVCSPGHSATVCLWPPCARGPRVFSRTPGCCVPVTSRVFSRTGRLVCACDPMCSAGSAGCCVFSVFSRTPSCYVSMLPVCSPGHPACVCLCPPCSLQDAWLVCVCDLTCILQDARLLCACDLMCSPGRAGWCVPLTLLRSLCSPGCAGGLVPLLLLLLLSRFSHGRLCATP